MQARGYNYTHRSEVDFNNPINQLTLSKKYDKLLEDMTDEEKTEAWDQLFEDIRQKRAREWLLQQLLNPFEPNFIGRSVCA